ncbi:MAG: type II toxin-antitoxin system RelE/ParE family toxin [Vulcanimicrobiaceae bacterium]
MAELPYLTERHHKPIAWVGSSKKDLKAMPEEVQDDIGYALDLAQHGKQADYAKRMHGDLRDVIEIHADNERGDSTFRAAYTIELSETVYVLHAFQKKAKGGIATPRRELDLIRQRLKQAREHHEETKRRK